MGAGACSKCSEMQLKAGLAQEKPLDAESSEGDDEEGGDDEEEEEAEAEVDDEEERHQQEAREAAEEALAEVLKRGKTAVFKEAIETAANLGVDEEKIKMAEKKLEEHKFLKKKEAFQEELDAFMKKGSDDAEVYREWLEKAKTFKCDAKQLKTLEQKIESLSHNRGLESHEVEAAKDLVVTLTRHFVASCMEGRPMRYVDQEEGEIFDCTASFDLTLKNLTVALDDKDEPLTCKISEARGIRAKELDTDVFEIVEEIAGDEAENCVALIGGDDQWCFLERDHVGVEEFIAALQVLGIANPVGGGGGGKKKKSTRSSTTSGASPKSRKSKAPKGGAFSPQNSDAGSAPGTPRSGAGTPRKSKSDKKGKKSIKPAAEEAEEEAEGEEEDESPKKKKSEKGDKEKKKKKK